MCLLTAFESGVQPNVKNLMTGAGINDDGHGFAIECGSGLMVLHGLDAETVLAEFAAMRKRFPHGPALFHSRWSTAGGPGLGNCQPFQVDADTVLAHNGTIPDLKEKVTGDKAGRSDSRFFVEEGMLPRNLHHCKVRGALEKYLGDSSMVVIRQGKLHIFNERHGIRRDGVWYSNSDFIPAGNALDHSWAKEMAHFDARLAYRQYGQKLLADPQADHLNRKRAELLKAHPQLMTGALR